MSALFSTDTLYSETDFSALEADLLQTGRRLQFARDITLQARPGEILMLTAGSMLITDREEDGLAVGHTFRYMPLGLIERYYPDMALFYRTECRVTAIQLTLEEFDAVFCHQSTHSEAFARIMTYMAAQLIDVYYERNNNSGYATIREMLYRYQYKAGEETLHGEGVAAFILRRTRLSRSYVFQILAGLKAGGYITVRGGRLVSINRDIPERY
jgi:CRP-like cAMP-binding protein